MKTNTETKSCSNEYFRERDDAMLAIDYIVNNLRSNNIHDIAEILADIIHIYNSTATHTKELADCLECRDTLYMYMSIKYHSKITLDKYKEKTLDMLHSELKNHEKDTL